MKSDSKIRNEVTGEFRWDPKTSNSNIQVEVEDGHVILTGVVDEYPKKIDAERAALRVSGVIWVTNKIVVRVADKRTDEEIRRAIVKAITWNTGIKENHVEVSVHEGTVTLEGEVAFEYQRSKARNLAEDVSGVVEVINLINVEPSMAEKEK